MGTRSKLGDQPVLAVWLRLGFDLVFVTGLTGFQARALVPGGEARDDHRGRRDRQWQDNSVAAVPGRIWLGSGCGCTAVAC